MPRWYFPSDIAERLRIGYGRNELTLDFLDGFRRPRSNCAAPSAKPTILTLLAKRERPVSLSQSELCIETNVNLGPIGQTKTTLRRGIKISEIESTHDADLLRPILEKYFGKVALLVVRHRFQTKDETILERFEGLGKRAPVFPLPDWNRMNLKDPALQEEILLKFGSLFYRIVQEPSVRVKTQQLVGLTNFANPDGKGVATTVAEFHLPKNCSRRELAIGFRRTVAEAMTTLRCSDVCHWGTTILYWSYRGCIPIDAAFFEESIAKFELQSCMRECEHVEDENHIRIEAHALVNDTENRSTPDVQDETREMFFVFIDFVRARTSGNSVRGSVAEKVLGGATEHEDDILDDVDLGRLRHAYGAIGEIFSLIDTVRPRGPGGLVTSLLSMNLGTRKGVHLELPKYTERATPERLAKMQEEALRAARVKQRRAKRILAQKAWKEYKFEQKVIAFSKLKLRKNSKQKPPEPPVKYRDEIGEFKRLKREVACKLKPVPLPYMDPMYTIFAEGPGLIFGVTRRMIPILKQRLGNENIRYVGRTIDMPFFGAAAGDRNPWFRMAMDKLRAEWFRTMVDAHAEEAQLLRSVLPPPTYRFTFTLKTIPTTHVRPLVGIICDGECDSQLVGKAFALAGFTVRPVKDVDADLQHHKGLVFIGAAPIDGVLPPGRLWATRARKSASLKAFFDRKDTFSLGIGTGCLMLSALWPFASDTDSDPMFIRNKSDRIAYCKHAQVSIPFSPARKVWFTDMVGSEMPCTAAHAFGCYVGPSHRIPLTFVDATGRAAVTFPENPFGSQSGRAGIVSTDGRHLGLMVHPERFIEDDDYTYRPAAWPPGWAPWMQMFHNARAWCHAPTVTVDDEVEKVPVTRTQAPELIVTSIKTSSLPSVPQPPFPCVRKRTIKKRKREVAPERTIMLEQKPELAAKRTIKKLASQVAPERGIKKLDSQVLSERMIKKLDSPVGAERTIKKLGAVAAAERMMKKLHSASVPERTIKKLDTQLAPDRTMKKLDPPVAPERTKQRLEQKPEVRPGRRAKKLKQKAEVEPGQTIMKIIQKPVVSDPHDAQRLTKQDKRRPPVPLFRDPQRSTIQHKQSPVMSVSRDAHQTTIQEKHSAGVPDHHVALGPTMRKSQKPVASVVCGTHKAVIQNTQNPVVQSVRDAQREVIHNKQNPIASVPGDAQWSTRRSKRTPVVPVRDTQRPAIQKKQNCVSSASHHAQSPTIQENEKRVVQSVGDAPRRTIEETQNSAASVPYVSQRPRIQNKQNSVALVPNDAQHPTIQNAEHPVMPVSQDAQQPMRQKRHLPDIALRTRRKKRKLNARHRSNSSGEESYEDIDGDIDLWNIKKYFPVVEERAKSPEPIRRGRGRGRRASRYTAPRKPQGPPKPKTAPKPKASPKPKATPKPKAARMPKAAPKPKGVAGPKRKST